jgi:hypothetical protein
MSSYFDTASTMFMQAMRNKPEAEAEKIVATVVETYGTYLTYISKHLDARSRPFFENVKERWTKLIARPLIDGMDRDTFVSFLISDLHDFAHMVGSSGMKRRDGLPFLDNPYVAVKTDMVMEAMR